jgi:regulator of protease activity HflC (stomatin/prohibitin superfamily)
VTETAHTRSRRAALGGLLLQLVASGVLLILGLATGSEAIQHLTWYVLGGVPLWFVSLLVFRQRELAALEALDLEELRRERHESGGEALFGDGAGFRIAEARLQWMRKWLVPGFSLATALYLAAAGILLWHRLAGGQAPLLIGAPGWGPLNQVPVALVVLAILMLGTFLFSRYASGMGRSAEWQLLRGCGSYMLGNALLMIAVLIGLGVYQYTRQSIDATGHVGLEQALAYAIPALMVVLAIEMLLNLILDIYRPRAPGVEPRAAFDSRLLGLFAEPGGIASSIADAINYQFGFQVSQTWFYQLLQRAFVPLVLVGGLALWLLTCIVLVQPYEHVVIERWGRQLNADSPLGSGVHLKLPWPIDVARAYNTGQLHEIHVGFRDFEASGELIDPNEALRPALWTDERHMGQEHFDFLISPPPSVLRVQTEGDERAGGDTPVHLIRLDAAVQYRIRPDQLESYTNASHDPHRAIIDFAWEEVQRFAAGTNAEALLSTELSAIGDVLRARIAARVQPLGLEVVYVGVTNVHPERTVAEAFRNVVKAEQEKTAAIREALVTENERLSKVVGETGRARVLAVAIQNAREAIETVNRAERALQKVPPAALVAAEKQLDVLQAALLADVVAQARLATALERFRQVELAFELGLGQTLEARSQAALDINDARTAAETAHQALLAAEEPLRAKLAGLDELQVAALLDRSRALVARDYWERELAERFTPQRLEGEAAAMLARALAERWAMEMDAARQVAQLENEREAYYAAPAVYKVRRLANVLTAGLKDARKYFLAFDPGDRIVRIRLVTEDDLRLNPEDLPARSN